MFSNYNFSNSIFFIIFFSNFLLNFFQNFVLKIENYVWNYLFNFFFKKLSIYLYIYLNLKFYIPKTLLHPSTLNPKFRLVNPRGINVFYLSLKVKVKIICINMKSGHMNMVFMTISLINISACSVFILILDWMYTKFENILFK